MVTAMGNKKGMGMNMVPHVCAKKDNMSMMMKKGDMTQPRKMKGSMKRSEPLRLAKETKGKKSKFGSSSDRLPHPVNQEMRERMRRPLI